MSVWKLLGNFLGSGTRCSRIGTMVKIARRCKHSSTRKKTPNPFDFFSRIATRMSPRFNPNLARALLSIISFKNAPQQFPLNLLLNKHSTQLFQAIARRNSLSVQKSKEKHFLQNSAVHLVLFFFFASFSILWSKTHHTYVICIHLSIYPFLFFVCISWLFSSRSLFRLLIEIIMMMK